MAKSTFGTLPVIMMSLYTFLFFKETFTAVRVYSRFQTSSFPGQAVKDSYDAMERIEDLMSQCVSWSLSS
jgi:hypothetical protein